MTRGLDRRTGAHLYVAQEARKASSGAAIHDDWKARQAQQAGDIDALERAIDGQGERLNRSMSGGVESRHAVGKPQQSGGSSLERSWPDSQPLGAATAGVAPGPLTLNAAANGARLGKAGTEVTPIPSASAAAPNQRAKADAGRVGQLGAKPCGRPGGERSDAAISAPIPYERDVLAGCLKALALHRRVAWAHRMNVGGMVDTRGQHVRFGFKGCSDIIGQLVTGEFLAIECKRPGAKPTDDQLAFLGQVQRAGGVAFVAWSIDDIARGLA